MNKSNKDLRHVFQVLFFINLSKWERKQNKEVDIHSDRDPFYIYLCSNRIRSYGDHIVSTDFNAHRVRISYKTSRPCFECKMAFLPFSL